MPASYDFYDYVGYWKNRRYEDLSEKLALNRLFNFIKEKDNILDIGGGFGRLSFVYANLYKNCTVADPSGNLLKTAKNNLKDYENIKYKICNLPKLPFKNEQFDTVLMVRVVHHIGTPLSSFKEIHRILEPKGYFILEFANKIHFFARLKALLRLNFLYHKDISAIDRRSRESIDSKLITFVNHHPDKILSDLKLSGFQPEVILSVSNFRQNYFKKIIPLKILLFLEKHLQVPFSGLYFGPSIFVLSRKIDA